eukprot:6837172-Prymnesium_polylepis.2
MALQRAMSGRRASCQGGRASILHPSSTSRLKHGTPTPTNAANQVADAAPTSRRADHKRRGAGHD